MKLPRNLHGEALVAHLCKKWGFRKVHQVGSHIILQTDDPVSHRLAVPAHRSLKIGTLNAILADVAAHKNVLKEDILKDL